MKTKVMIMGSVAGAGKTTVAEYLTRHYNFHEVTFATPLYEIAREYFGMRGKNRGLLQDIGQKMREIDADVWVNYAFDEAKLYESVENIVISDVRQMNEFSRGIKEGYIPLRVVCDRDVAIQRMIVRDGFCDESKLDGVMEDQTRELIVPQVYNNSSVEDFYREIDQFVRSICFSEGCK